MLTRGYGSFDYEPIEYRKTDVVKVESSLTKNPSTRSRILSIATNHARELYTIDEQLAEAIPRHQFKIPIQGAIGGEIIARSTIQRFGKTLPLSFTVAM